jgi:hypothetical protein
MNKRQLIVFWIAVGLIVLMGLVPPWIGGGCAPIFQPPVQYYSRYVSRLDTERLFVQWFMVAGVGAALIWTFKTDTAAQRKPPV